MVNEDKATRYQRHRWRASALAAVATVLFVSAMLLGHGATSLRDAVRTVTGDATVVAVALYAWVFALLVDLVTLPFAFYQGVALERRYRLPPPSTRRWWVDRAQALGVGAMVRVAEALILTAILRSAPAYWWLVAALVFSALLVGFARMAPVLVMPMFYRFEPLDRPALAGRLLVLAQRAKADVIDVFEWQGSDRARGSRAALAGIGRTRRILLSDTLLAEHSDDEIEVILAHELAHYVHGDIWSGLLVESLLIGTGFFLASVILAASADSLGLDGVRDLAALPLIALVVGSTMTVLTPIANAVSRAHERRADRYALEMTRNPAAFVSAVKRLSSQNLSVERPPRWSEWFFDSHPSTSARIAAAQAWAADRSA